MWHGRIQDFFQEGVHSSLALFNTNKPHSFSFFVEYQLYQKTAGHLEGGRGGAHPLHPPPRSAPVWLFLVVIISGEWIKRIRRGKSNNIGLILPVLTTSTVPTRVPIGKKFMLSALHLRFNVNLSYIQKEIVFKH